MNEWTPKGPLAEPVYDRAEPQSGRALVNFHLRELGLGESWLVRTDVDGQRFCRHVVPQGLGVCRAYVLTEAAWPQGAELCVTVTWTPDAALRRDGRTGRVPTGAEEHWRMRIAATAQALESLGYLVEPSRFRCSPRYYFTAELLVYRMPAGVPPRQRPAATAWALSAPVPPHYQRWDWYPDRWPQDVVRDALREAGLGFFQRDQTPFGRIAVRDITQTVWPPEAALCVWLTWWPTTAFARDPGTGLAPDGAEEHWRECLDRLQQALTGAGLALRSRARPWNPDTDETADVLVYRATSPLSTSE
ncbi:MULTISPECIES: hypothetical protein [unclassified Streptomyces]|uniref:hypothetical protein n=1 Tax=unclassified Streptomyces TaxID=2593676 RepID=UPI0008DD9FB2|nr:MULTISPECIES: hypothetical protein [unclassified Streptomyces]OII68698.1 hypothetical protein BJP39_20315 [Streptomyces sp. CC77]